MKLNILQAKEDLFSLVWHSRLESANFRGRILAPHVIQGQPLLDNRGQMANRYNDEQPRRVLQDGLQIPVKLLCGGIDSRHYDRGVVPYVSWLGHLWGWLVEKNAGDGVDDQPGVSEEEEKEEEPICLSACQQAPSECELG